jgi:predicted tellurium resistance membrane protein TerC
MKHSIFKRNALRIKCLLIGIAVAMVFAVFKTFLGNYLIGLAETVDTQYQWFGTVSLLFFATIGFSLFYHIIKLFQEYYNKKLNEEKITETLFKKAKQISRRLLYSLFLINIILYATSSIILYFVIYRTAPTFGEGLRI